MIIQYEYRVTSLLTFDLNGSIIVEKGCVPPTPRRSDILGLEAVGVVDKLGAGCGSSWKVGDRVMALLPGTCIFDVFLYVLKL